MKSVLRRLLPGVGGGGGCERFSDRRISQKILSGFRI